jgi:hypothetical protein
METPSMEMLALVALLVAVLVDTLVLVIFQYPLWAAVAVALVLLALVLLVQVGLILIP